MAARCQNSCDTTLRAQKLVGTAYTHFRDILICLWFCVIRFRADLVYASPYKINSSTYIFTGSSYRNHNLNPSTSGTNGIIDYAIVCMALHRL